MIRKTIICLIFSLLVGPTQAQLMGMGMGRASCGGSSNPCAFVPLVNGVLMSPYANLKESLYYYNGTSYTTLATWCSAAGCTYARTGAANYFGSNGCLASASTGVARFAYNPSTLAALGLRLTPAQTELTLHNRDLTQASWTASNITTALDQSGLDCLSNTASSLTATAGNGTVLQSITNANNLRITGAWLKRITGTGEIDLTQDNGATWVSQTITGSWAFYPLASTTSANPTVGIRIVNNGDKIAVDYFSERSGISPAVIPDPIATVASTATQNTDSLVFASPSWYSQSTSTMFAQFDFVANNVGIVSFDSGNSTDRAGYYVNGSGNLKSAWSNPTYAEIGITVLSSFTQYKSAMAWASSDGAQTVNGAATTSTSSNVVPTSGITQLEFMHLQGVTGVFSGDFGLWCYLASRTANGEMQLLVNRSN